MKTSLMKSTVLLTCCLFLSACADIGMRMPWPGNSRGGPPATTAGVSVSVGITADEARSIARELNLVNLRPLPRGIARNLERGKALPPGLARRYPPSNMWTRLPRIEGHEWQVAGRDLILVTVGTLIVVEILEGVFR